MKLTVQRNVKNGDFDFDFHFTEKNVKNTIGQFKFCHNSNE